MILYYKIIISEVHKFQLFFSTKTFPYSNDSNISSKNKNIYVLFALNYFNNVINIMDSKTKGFLI